MRAFIFVKQITQKDIFALTIHYHYGININRGVNKIVIMHLL